jgi:Tfp pilus assembly protein PilX
MKTFSKPSSEKGIVIVISLILLLVMTTMGVGLVYTTGRNDKGAQGVISRIETMQAAETCIQSMERWFNKESVNGPPCKTVAQGAVCHREKETLMGDAAYKLPEEKDKFKDRMNQYRNSCEVALLTTLSEKDSVVGTGAGFEVGKDGAYGGSSTRTKYLYKITAQGTGPNSSASTVEVIASMIY